MQQHLCDLDQFRTPEVMGGRTEYVLLVVVALGAYTIEELTAGAEVKDEVEVVRGLYS